LTWAAGASYIFRVKGAEMRNDANSFGTTVWPALAVFLMASATIALIEVGPAAAADIKVTTKGAAYSPAVIAAKVGDVLQFENNDTATHAVFVPTKTFGVNLEDMGPGRRSSLALPRAGFFEVECVYHPEMLLKVTVSP
jgi:plastocyanin